MGRFQPFLSVNNRREIEKIDRRQRKTIFVYYGVIDDNRLSEFAKIVRKRRESNYRREEEIIALGALKGRKGNVPFAIV